MIIHTRVGLLVRTRTKNDESESLVRRATLKYSIHVKCDL